MLEPYAKLLAKIHHAIVEGDFAEANPLLTPTLRLSPTAQLHIYREGYCVRLADTVASDYPATAHFLGKESFNMLLQDFVCMTPSDSYNLDYYPMKFAAFIRSVCCKGAGKAQSKFRLGFGKRAQPTLKFAAELAELEGGILRTFHAPDSPALIPAHLAGLDETNFGQLVLKLRTASTLCQFKYPVNDYLTAFRTGEKHPLQTIGYSKRSVCTNLPGMVQMPAKSAGLLYPTPYYLFLVRHPREVHRYPLNEAQFLLLSHLGTGISVSQALENLLTTREDLITIVSQSLMNWFQEWVNHGYFQSIE